MLRALLCAALLAGAATAARSADGFVFAGIRAHLFYEHSGQLSENILVSKPVLWNTIIGEGGVAEPASDVLVVVEMQGPPEGSTETPLEIEVIYERDGQTIRKARSFGFLYTEFGERRIARALWLDDATCEPLKIVATHGDDRREAEVPFHCGE